MSSAEPPEKALPPPSLTAAAILEDTTLAVRLTLAGGSSGLGRRVDHARIQKSGLALAGHYHGVVPTRVQILGATELTFLASLGPGARASALAGFFGLGLSLVVVTAAGPAGAATPARAELAEAADRAGAPLAFAASRSSHAIAALHLLLDERLAPRATVHGVLIDVFGLGMLLIGKSGIGKSECALEMVMRGHRLVADDVVRCDWRPPGLVFGGPAELLRHHIEVRGLGVLNIKDLLGVTATRERKRIDLVVRLLEWSDEAGGVERMGVDDRYHEVLGVKIRELRVPIRPGRSMASILEVAARNELVRAAGVHSARDFFARLNRTLVGSSADTESELLYPPSSSREGPAGGQGGAS
ncbi:MAG TPA: HPr(Ser) kinase/phosphatase [Polyangiaceae bacterium]|nr:HPr(Ser) kinase/phosphatase [Polyangiaceae bacterium]